MQVLVDPTNTSFVVLPHLENFSINGPGAIATSQDGINISDANGSLKDMYIDHVGIFGIGGDGLNCTSGIKLWIDHFYTEDNLGNGVVLNNDGMTCRIANMYCYGNALCGFKVVGANSVDLSHSEIWQNKQYGLYLGAAANFAGLISSVNFVDNGTGEYSSIIVQTLEPMTTGVVSISGCYILDDRGSGFPNQLITLGTTGNTTLNLNFSNNRVSSAGGTNPSNLLGFAAALLLGSMTIKNNIGLNPFNRLTNPFNTTTLGLNGTGATPSASTDYTVFCCDVFLNAADSSNSDNTILIKDAAGNTALGPVHTLTAQYVPVGYKVNWGAFTGNAGAVSVFGI